ncbi:hypothetical protein PROFUN_05641 [Planoprotostelium fungivorum]|uniref:Uncharacterized protein n=1 Tax=Planoprotostelium fungivorum TaxID=1890364 RepID=A0A2P6MUE7_9EUKA|nr:hypothetical protein PROFUN_05641 [Planoprotostelium fungivorum]
MATEHHEAQVLDRFSYKPPSFPYRIFPTMRNIILASALLFACVTAAPSGIFSTKDIFGKWQTNITTFPNKAHIELKGTFSDVTIPNGFSLSLWKAEYATQQWLADVSSKEGQVTIDVNSPSDSSFQLILRAWHPQDALNTVDFLWSKKYNTKSDYFLNPIDCKYQAKKLCSVTNTLTFNAKGKACASLPLRIDLADLTFGENELYRDSVLKTNVKEGENSVKLNKAMRPNQRSSMNIAFYVENPQLKGSVQQVATASLPVSAN